MENLSPNNLDPPLELQHAYHEKGVAQPDQYSSVKNEKISYSDVGLI